jgi:TRAP-type mannitol/chloroaromatic compound transport system permease small subunit
MTGASLVVAGLAGLVVAVILAGIAFADRPATRAWLFGADRLSAFVGRAAAWSIVLLTAVIMYDVTARYVFRAPTSWAFDISYMLYGVLFMLSGAYALSRNGHVRGDFMYRSFSPRLQGKFDLTLYILFFFPGIFALMVQGWFFFELSFIQNERSAMSPDGPIIWPFKAVIPLAGALLLLQGLAEVVRCVQCIRNNAWPSRLIDVEELDVALINAAQTEGLDALTARVAQGGAQAAIVTTQGPGH